MTNDTPIDPLQRGLQAVPSTPAKGAQPKGVGSAASPADATQPSFQVLLERLQQSASALERESASVEEPDELAGAVDRARESLQDALTLKEELLEAWRQSAQQTPDTGADA